MPYIDIKTNISLTPEKTSALKSDLAEILASSFPGKTENWLMLGFADNAVMYFGGSDAPCMLLDVSIFGAQSDKSYDSMTRALCSLIEEKYGIPADRVYVKYSEYSRWGWNNMNF